MEGVPVSGELDMSPGSLFADIMLEAFESDRLEAGLLTWHDMNKLHRARGKELDWWAARVGLSRRPSESDYMLRDRVALAGTSKIDLADYVMWVNFPFPDVDGAAPWG